MTAMRKTTKKKEEVITLSRLMSEYGLTKRVVEKYLPNPILKKNPYYACAPQMRLYRVKDVKRLISRNKTVQAEIARHKTASAHAEKGVETKMEKMRQTIEKAILLIRVQRVSKVETKAIESYNNHKEAISWERGDFDFDRVSPNSVDRAFLNRITVNYIRHNLTTYDFSLYCVRGRTGIGLFYVRYKNAVLDKIAEIYPEYREECERQKIEEVAEEKKGDSDVEDTH